MKGLMKNFRYIFHIFEEEEEEEDEMQIGLPTDVKHVAHIGWDGPSVNSPSWMEDFKSTPGNASSQPNGDSNRGIEDADWGSQDSTTKKGVRESPVRDLTLPKSSRRQASMDSIGSLDSALESPTQKTSKSSKRRSKKKDKNSSKDSETSNSQNLPNIPKKSRRKKSKDNGDGSLKSTSSMSKDKGSKHGSMHGSEDGSVSKKYD